MLPRQAMNRQRQETKLNFITSMQPIWSPQMSYYNFAKEKKTLNQKQAVQSKHKITFLFMCNYVGEHACYSYHSTYAKYILKKTGCTEIAVVCQANAYKNLCSAPPLIIEFHFVFFLSHQFGPLVGSHTGFSLFWPR